ncbi:hypothetical protein EDM29_15395, partial [Staphylococcus aureus]
IVTSNNDEFTTITGLLKELLSEDSEILTIFAGEDANPDVSDKLIEWIESEYPELEVEEHNGGQRLL